MKIKFNGEEKELDILYKFHSENTNKDYIICSMNTSVNDSLDVTAFIVRNRKIEKIELDEDWNEIDKFISLYSGV